MGLFDSKESKLAEQLKDFKVYTYKPDFEEDIDDTRLIMAWGLNMYDTIIDQIKWCKRNGYHAIISAAIGGGGDSLHFTGTAVKLKSKL